MSAAREIRRLAIVNRGEAAMRCIRAVKALRTHHGDDIKAIALYTDPDRDAPFVRHADLSVPLAPAATAVAAYLDRDALIESLRRTRADAVWPGWGFVAEDANFVEQVRAAGITFLGPSPEAMRAVGDKIRSKQLAERAGVPVSAWSGGELEDESQAIAAAETVGYPVVVKASAGGGGRGIRVVTSADELPEAYRSAQSEATSAFGDGRLFLEAMVSGGRHIEVQIAADQHGHVFAVGCRDCSVQRRHQKVLEEAPPPHLARDLCQRIEAAAVRVATEVGYEGVGTVEFLVTESEFFFLEVNPRLQVEHGITEELTGLDLVQLQIRIARGEDLGGLVIEERGASIEARVCAEDPEAGFLPSPGRIGRFDPAQGAGIRIDSGVSAGSTVPSDFDSLVAKVIATGRDREEARARLVCALRDFELVVEGGATNKGYLLTLLESEDYRAGDFDTTWLDRFNDERDGGVVDRDEAVCRDALVAAAILAYQRNRAAARVNFYTDTTSLGAERIPASVGQQVDLSESGESYRLEVYAIGSWRYRVHLDGRVVGALMREEDPHSVRLQVGERTRRVLHDATDAGLRLEIEGQPLRFGWQTAGQVRASTPAMVVAVHVSVGDSVRAGESIGLVEAMKMEIDFQAPVTGVVKEVFVRKGQQVAAGDVLLAIEPAASETETATEAARLALPDEPDPLALLFRPDGEQVLGTPDLTAADRAVPLARREAIDALRDEIRRLLLGYDANRARGEALLAFLEAPLPDSLSEPFRLELSEVRRELTTFADLEQLFIRSPRASVSGELGPSNNARFRMVVRRLHAGGAGIAEEFLELVRRALSHYGLSDLEPCDALERAVLRLLSTQQEPDLRLRLVLGMVRRMVALAQSGLDLSADVELADAMLRIAGMRGLLPDTLADAAIDAGDVLFEGPAAERQAEGRSRDARAWLAEAERTDAPTAPPREVLLELAVAPRQLFDRVAAWLSISEPSRRSIAVAAHVQRFYAPAIPREHTSARVEDSLIHCVEFEDDHIVLAAAAASKEVAQVAERLLAAAGRLDGQAASRLHALELLVPVDSDADRETAQAALLAHLERAPAPCRTTLTFLPDGEAPSHRTFVVEEEGPRELADLHHLHPAVAERIDLARYGAFELERMASEDSIYAFYGRSREVPGDERVFVLADVQAGSPLGERNATPYLAAFERAFYRATGTLRNILQLRDPRRRLQWNRVALVVSPPIFLEPETASLLARRLAPATRHLGLEKVVVRLSLLTRETPDVAARPAEIVFTDPTGAQMEISWRDPHVDPLHPAEEYERRVVEARRRRQVYPYEIVRMLTTEGPGGPGALPSGEFEEYDLDAEGRTQSVAGRAHGHNESAVVFGIVSTPTDKVPEGMRRVLVLSDPTRGMGALAEAECARLVAALDLAERERLPVEWLPVSSGARIAMDSGTENLDATARVVRRIVTFTQAGGVIHVIVHGVNVGAQSYFDALATMLTHTRGVLIMTPNASMVLTGRAALEASGAVAAEDAVAIGGYERIMGPNGEGQYYARNLAEAYRLLYEHYRYTYVVPGETGPRRSECVDPFDRDIGQVTVEGEETFDFTRVGDIFDDGENPGRKRPFPMRAVMRSLVDVEGGFQERWRGWVGAETAIVWDTEVGGFPVTLIGIESHNAPRQGYRPLDGPESWTGGTLFPLSSKKVARALNAASGNRPAIVLANLSGFDGSPESLRKLQLEYGAEIARAVVNFDGPVLFVVVSRYHGGAYVVFSQELNPGLRASALEGSYASVIGGGPAAAVVFAREVRARALADPRVETLRRGLRLRPSAEAQAELDELLREVTLEKQAELAAEFDRIHTVERAQEVGSLSDLLPPSQLRPYLIRELEAAAD
ncbi:MAG: ATP-grasp domain-containing protein [Proteobacteria bacterium]|nr:ATP-grasp domain-containing protein [Pseudomonadota bacterium]